MAKTNSAKLVLDIRRHGKQKALQAALLVPWQELAESAADFASWQVFLLWVRAITEAVEQLPDVARSVLQDRCPGFLEFHSRACSGDLPLWKSLEEWGVDHFFGKARAEGWFDALMYYAYTDLRTEQAWTCWGRTKAVWRDSPPREWPTLEQWTADVVSTRTLTNCGTEKARAVQALGRVETERLFKAVSCLLESRALALWVDAVSKPSQSLKENVVTELCSLCPDLPSSYFESLWVPTVFYRLIRFGESKWRDLARLEGWYSALRYHVIHHPRYQRLIHYNQRCHDEWSQARPTTYPSFPNWLSAADAYCVGQEA